MNGASSHIQFAMKNLKLKKREQKTFDLPRREFESQMYFGKSPNILSANFGSMRDFD